MTRTIAITTPTGNVGRKLAAYYRRAREHGVHVVVLARKPEALGALRGSGIEIAAGRLEDRDFLVEATRGVSALYWATPNSFAPELSMRAAYRQFAEAAAHAIRTNEIPHTVHLSGFAHVEDGGGERSLFGALADTEAILGRAVLDLQGAYPARRFGITHVRAGFFFENLLGQLDYIRDHGLVFLPVDRTQRIPMVASHDVAEQIAKSLLADPPDGRVFRGAWGPEDLSFSDVAAKLSEGLGRRIRVLRLPRGLIRFQMRRLGRDPRTTDALLSAFGAISAGRVTAEPARDASSTTTMSLTQWAAEVLKPLVEGLDGEVCPARVQYEPPEVGAAVG